MRGHHRLAAAAFCAAHVWSATGTAASALQPQFTDSFLDARNLTLPTPDLAPSAPPVEFAAGASAEAQALFSLPEAPAPPVEGPFAQFERRNPRPSLLPWDLLDEEESGFAVAPLAPLLGATALLLWLVVAGGSSQAARRPKRRRRRRRSTSAAA
jgi:hypothetical protein